MSPDTPKLEWPEDPRDYRRRPWLRRIQIALIGSASGAILVMVIALLFGLLNTPK